MASDLSKLIVSMVPMLRLSDCVWFLVVSPHRGLQFLVSCLTVQLSLSWLCCLSGYRRNGTCDHTTPALKNWPWTMVMLLPGAEGCFPSLEVSFGRKTLRLFHSCLHTRACCHFCSGFDHFPGIYLRKQASFHLEFSF